jgi:hypothetical protein
MKKLESWLLHPFLFGIFPVLAMLAYNISQIGPMFAIRPLLISLTLTLISFIFYRFLLKDDQRAAIATSFFLLLFFTYGHVFNFTQNMTIGGMAISKVRYLGTLWLVLFVGGNWLIIWKIRNPRAWTFPLNGVGLILVVISILQISLFEVHALGTRYQAQSVKTRSIAAQLHPPLGKPLPDIYYIVPEDYTRSDGLKLAYQGDNSSFLAALQQQGFYVVSCSLSNYVFSVESIAAALNMQYLAQLDSRFSPPNTQLGDLDPYLQDNAVGQTLKDLGYNFISFQSGFPPTEFRNADLYLSDQSDIDNLNLLGGMTPFEAQLFQTTLGDIFIQIHIIPQDLVNSLYSSAYLLDRDRILYELNKVAQLPSIPGPKFVFVHLLGPHNPFVFGPHGEVLTRTVPFTYNDDLAARSSTYNAGYDGEITYLDSRFLQIVTTILERSTTPPIIIIQSDTGSTRAPDWVNTNLSAVYFPGGGESALYPTLTQVNTFRVVFNTYFGGHLNLLPDRTCDSSSKDPYACIPKGDPNPQCLAPAKP